ncbi:beta-1,6-N-acetylglucosaminyltransferase [Megasphaera elsdenii]|uniref:beta-1,6-N-acetylglucosaminyltransferase n=1 Tax=Megasphaera elsdenii TaxID=907 RepID=UPI0040361C02
MRHAYLIMAHDDFYLLKRLIKVIDNPDADIYIHLDANRKYNIDNLENISKYSHTYITSRIKINWGGQSIIACELFLMEQAAKKNYGFYHLLSGHDFLLRSVQEIQQFFEKNEGKEFLSVDVNPYNKKDIYNRLDQYHLIFNNRIITNHINEILSPIQQFFHIHRMDSSLFDVFAKGMEWASMTNNFVHRLLRDRGDIMQWTQHSLCADEVYKQIEFKRYSNEFSLYRSIPKEASRARCFLEAEATMHLVDWTRGNPYTFDIDDLPYLLSSECMFARKFDSRVDKKIIDSLFKLDTGSDFIM